MADLSVTAANVVPQTGASINKNYVFGETVTAGMPVYLSTENKWMKALNDTAAHAAATGLAVNGGSLNQPAAVAQVGTVSFGAILTAGEIYCVSDTAGALAPVADIGPGEVTTICGVATTTSLMRLIMVTAGVAHG
jgi:hypothetical protein